MTFTDVITLTGEDLILAIEEHIKGWTWTKDPTGGWIGVEVGGKKKRRVKALPQHCQTWSSTMTLFWDHGDLVTLQKGAKEMHILTPFESIPLIRVKDHADAREAMCKLLLWQHMQEKNG